VKPWHGRKPGEVWDHPRGAARLLIKRGIAKATRVGGFDSLKGADQPPSADQPPVADQPTQEPKAKTRRKKVAKR